MIPTFALKPSRSITVDIPVIQRAIVPQLLLGQQSGASQGADSLSNCHRKGMLCATFLSSEDFMTLAIFDLDNTLIAGDSDYSWGEFLVARNQVDAVEYQQANEKFYQDYQRGALDIMEYLRFSLKPLAQRPLAELAALHREFMATVIEPMFLPKAAALLQQHREHGDYLLVITSTNRFIVEPICQRLGVDDLLATELAMKAGVYTGEVEGTPTFREGKVARLQQWLAPRNESLQGSYFYSDSINDLPLLEIVDKPVAVDPDDELGAIARERGWPIISLRD
jgi:HAD superfamily hydrolase (TIGR01490 family)